MSIYVLTEYIEECKIKGIEPTWQRTSQMEKRKCGESNRF